MKIKDLRISFLNALSTIYDQEEILSFFYLLSESILGLKRVDVALYLDKEISEEEMTSFESAKKRLEIQEPIQYIIGETHFFGLDFKVDPNVLIPRPETEELVDWILQDYNVKSKSIRILDIGTGSGCIAISLAKNLPGSEVFAIDVSQKAIEIARHNSKKNKVEVQFLEEDILGIEDLPKNFDVIVSNPPYVRELEKLEMKPNVLNNEPKQALFVKDDDPLIFYKKISELARRRLKPEGALYFEINQYLGQETKHLIENLGYRAVVLRKDLCSNERMIRARV